MILCNLECWSVQETGAVRVRETWDAALSEAGGQRAPWGVVGVAEPADFRVSRPQAIATP